MIEVTAVPALALMSVEQLRAMLARMRTVSK
jgi:hypothetical protein